MTLKNNFWKLSDAELMDLPARFGGENAEFMIIPGLMVASLFHAQLDDKRDISFPVGYVSFEPNFITEVSNKLLDRTTLQPNYNDYFDKKGIKEEQKFGIKSLCQYFSKFSRPANKWLLSDAPTLRSGTPQSQALGHHHEHRQS